ncbi:uncharacterized protein PAC_00392 [Phialocephala subalpina]|uniref:Uncharacterized protein n=1 Tax=Phialocephala subalpina TaxID=576137 RepID=A0A1L7WCV0_9HELO|nr:uncharacterized protein PAC_00392 [Phialocephala subalpina]
MDGQVELPVSLQKAQKSLGLCIKQRHEASKIRQVLSSHLGSQLNSSGHPLNRPLSLVDPAIDVEAASHGVRGLQREYLRSVRANIKARNEYAAISKEHHARRTGEDLESETQDFPQQSNSCLGMEAFIYLTMHQQKHERLRITQDYVDVLSQKPAATAEHLDPKVALRDVDSLPKVPPEVLHNASAGPAAGGTALKELVDLLEKSVLRAKMLLKKEQRLLAKVRADSSGSPESRGDRLQALGLTRNALINWIEAEMEKAGDGSVDVEDEELSNHDAGGKDYIEAQLASIQRQYGRYIEARQSLVTSATSISEPPVSTTKEEDSNVPALTDDSRPSQGMQIFYPYLEKLAFTANEQKAAIQQRSHLTISLAKQVKEASQGLDRLADESHLLPAHPMPTASSQRKGLEGPLSFNGELLNHEKPDSSARGRAWVYAAESAGTATKNAITEQLEEGGKAMEESRNSVSGLYHLLGYETQDDGLRKTGLKKDIWTALDGALGVIKGDGAEAR